MITSYSRSNLMALKIQTICSTSPLTYKRARSSASIIDLVTAFYLVACHTIGPLNKLIKKPYKLRHVRVLSIKLISEAAFRTWLILYSVIIEYLRAKYLIL